MATRQGTLTVVAPISREPGELEELRSRLAEVEKSVRNDRGDSGPVPFRKMRRLHYARWVIVEPQRTPDGRSFSASLLFSTQYDEPLDDHLAELIRWGEKGLIGIYERCENFDAESGPDAVRLRRYLRRYAHPARAFYVGAVRRSLARIEAEERLAAAIRQVARSLPETIAPHLAWSAIRAGVRRPALSDLEAEAGAPLHLERSRRIARIIWGSIQFGWLPAIGLALYLAPIAVGTAGVAVLALVHWLRSLEERDADELEKLESAESDADKSARESLHEERLGRLEGLWPQNQMTVVSPIKPSRLRRGLQRAILAVVRLRARFKFTRGLLDGVPTIHFAHWVVIDGGHRLVFVSNYDGGWSAYLDDFIAHAAMAVTAIWTHSYDFPKTRYLVYDGVTDAARFKRATRRHQIPPEVWYAAYPHLSVEEINRNSELVEGLDDERLGRPTRREATLEWLSKI